MAEGYYLFVTRSSVSQSTVNNFFNFLGFVHFSPLRGPLAGITFMLLSVYAPPTKGISSGYSQKKVVKLEAIASNNSNYK